MSCRYHYIFTNILGTCKAYFYKGIFKNFTANSLIHIIAFSPRTHETPFLPSILCGVHFLPWLFLCELHDSNVSTHFCWTMLKQYYRNTKKFSTALPREVLYVPPWPALGGWGPPTYNTLLLTHSIYVNKQKHRFILTNAYETIFYSTNATHKAVAMLQPRKMIFSKFSKMLMFFSTHISSFTFNRYHCKICSHFISHTWSVIRFD